MRFVGLAALLFASPVPAKPTEAAPIDAIFADMAGLSKPGCAVGVAKNGITLETRGYGSADLEHDVAITPDTIFEAGSVAKQFTVSSPHQVVRVDC